MRIARTLGLAALAALVMAVGIGSGSALAAKTTLCKSSADSPYCETADRYAEGTLIKSSSTNAAIEVGGGLSIKCTGSTLEVEKKADGEPMGAYPVKWSLEGCKLGPANCSSEEVRSSPSGGLAWTEADDGTLSVSNLQWKIICGGSLNCTFGTPSVTVKGGSPPSITATKQVVSKSGSICPKAPTFTATYSVSSPSVAAVAKAEAPPPPPTVLCKTNESYCPAPYRYPSGTNIEAAASNFSIEINGGSKITCKESKLTAKTLAEYGSPLPVEASSMTLGQCYLGGLSCSKSQVTNLSSEGLKKNEVEPYGEFKLNADMTFKCSAYECTYSLEEGYNAMYFNSSNEALETPATISVNERTIPGIGSCGKTGKLTVTFVVSTPDPVFVSLL